MVGADIDKPTVERLIVDAVGIGAGDRGIGKVVALDVLCVLLATPLSPFILKVSDANKLDNLPLNYDSEKSRVYKIVQ